MFSTRQKQLQWNNVPSIPAMVEFVDQIYGDNLLKPKQAFLPLVYNWAGWMGPHMNDLEGHSSPHVFKFERHSSGKVAMMHKPWHSSAQDFQGDHHAPAEPIFLFSHGIPPGHPPVMPPDALDPKHLQDIHSFFDWLPALAIAWWTAFLENPRPPLNLIMKIPANVWRFQDRQLHESVTHVETIAATPSSNSVAVSAARTSAHHVEPEAVAVPSLLSDGMLALVLPTHSSGDRFWMCKVHHVKNHDPLEYKVRYFQQDPSTQEWNLMTGRQGAYGIVPHDAVVVAGFSLTSSSRLRKSTLQQVEKRLNMM